MSDSADSRLSTRPLDISVDNVGAKMSQSLTIVMEWQETALPNRFAPGSKALRRLIVRVRKQPIDFMIILHQSLKSAEDGRTLCRAGCKASRVLLGEEDNSDRDKAQFAEIKLREIRDSASNLTEHTQGMQRRFRELRTSVINIRLHLDALAKKRLAPDLLTRLSDHLKGKGIKTCETVLQKVQDDLGDIHKSLDLIVSWWQEVVAEANYLHMNCKSALLTEKNSITLKDIKDGFMTLDKYFADYVEKIGQIYDENFPKLSCSNQKSVKELQDGDESAFSARELLKPPEE